MIEKTMFEGRFMRVTTEMRETPDGPRCYERVYLREGVLIILMTGPRTFRFLQEIKWSEEDLVSTKLVSGYMEDGEKPLEAAARELKEEVGITADTLWLFLTHEANGAVNKKRHYVVASGLHYGEATPEPCERIVGLTEELALEDVEQMAMAGVFGCEGSAYAILRLCHSIRTGLVVC